MAAVLGKAEESTGYRQLADDIGIAYNLRFWDEEAGGYGTNNQACNAISLYMGLVPENRIKRTAASLAQAVKQCGGHLSTGNICTKYLLETLSDHGYVDMAMSIAESDTYPSWGYMLANGATTLWERWELATGSGMNSHNHPMLGSIGAWFYRRLAGIQVDPSGPGFSRVIIAPIFPPGLSWVRASLQTVRGELVVAWKIERDELYVDLIIPVGCQAQVKFPLFLEGYIKESGVVCKDENKPVHLPEGISNVHQTDDHTILWVEAGEYHFCLASPVISRATRHGSWNHN
jgi:alpha-L-rhamnosidase